MYYRTESDLCYSLEGFKLCPDSFYSKFPEGFELLASATHRISVSNLMVQ